MTGDGMQRDASACGEASRVAERPLDVLYVAPKRFHASPQQGVQRRIAWAALAAALSPARVGNVKDVAGAWSPALYRGGIRRRSALITVGALVVDVDVGGDVDRVIEAVSRYRAIVHETFSSTQANPRCRILVHLEVPVDATSYEKLHAVVRAHLRQHGIEADEAAKDASRLSYFPVRRPGSSYRFATAEGVSLNASRVIAVQPSLPSARVRGGLPLIDGTGSYSGVALASAASAVASAGAGKRNDTLFHETFSVSRLADINARTIRTAMLDAALAAGLPETEAKRTIASALRTRRGVP